MASSYLDQQQVRIQSQKNNNKPFFCLLMHHHFAKKTNSNIICQTLGAVELTALSAAVPEFPFFLGLLRDFWLGDFAQVSNLVIICAKDLATHTYPTG